MFSLPGHSGTDVAQAAFYMEKLAVGREAAKAIDLSHGIAWNLARIAEAKRCRIEDLTVCILDRPRHEAAIAWICQAGAAIHLIQDGDVAGALMAAWHGSGVDVLYGIGGTPEAVIAACGLKCLRGAIQAKFWSEDPAELDRISALGLTNRIFDTDELVASDNVFFAATGVTDGKLLRGIRHDNQTGMITSNSLVMRSSTGTIRNIFTDHEHL
jgi:fructose-1,6-bisphosphatase II